MGDRPLSQQQPPPPGCGEINDGKVHKARWGSEVVMGQAGGRGGVGSEVARPVWGNEKKRQKR
jgi:hypothetical protein